MSFLGFWGPLELDTSQFLTFPSIAPTQPFPSIEEDNVDLNVNELDETLNAIETALKNNDENNAEVIEA